MAYGSYNQYDSRWGSKNYNGSSTMSGGGCGPTSCANILHNIDPSITPLTTMKYMQTHGDKDHKRFAIYGQGTAWNGITQCLKYYGAKEVKTPDVSNSMTKVWDVLKKGHVAIFLMKYICYRKNGKMRYTQIHQNCGEDSSEKKNLIIDQVQPVFRLRKRRKKNVWKRKHVRTGYAGHPGAAAHLDPCSEYPNRATG